MKNNQKYMQNRIRFLTIISWVVVVITVALVGAVIYDGATNGIGLVKVVPAPVTGTGAGIVVGVALAVVIALVGAAFFSGLNDQAALLQTALNLETNSEELVNEVRLMNKYLRAMVPFVKEPPGKP